MLKEPAVKKELKKDIHAQVAEIVIKCHNNGQKLLTFREIVSGRSRDKKDNPAT